MGIARKVVDKTAINEEEAISSSSTGLALDLFQDVYKELLSIESVGDIEIVFTNHESQTGKRHVDLVRFKRLK